MSNEPLKILELFAGVGGFRVGLERANFSLYQTKWANQWEPSKKAQDAFDCYDSHFKDSLNMNEDIASLSEEKLKEINADMIVGGFPCQDYSVARSLSGGKGIQGKKGVLFWEIIRLTKIIQPKYLLLENVDRLLKSPAKQRGRDFAIMLSAFNDLGYTVEWRVINAAEYGGAQRRRRVFIFISKNDTPLAQKLSNIDDDKVIYHDGLFAQEFPVTSDPNKGRRSTGKLVEDIVEISDNFTGNIYSTGIMRNGEYTTIETIPVEEKAVTLKEIIQPESEIDKKYYLDDEAVKKFEYLRGPKKIERTSAEGHKYIFSEGGMSPTDDLNKPGRTMLTSEGSKNRSTHLIEVNGRHRILTPIECERLNGFPDNWTDTMSDRMRYFAMGNALVTTIITRIGSRLEKMM
ncbi:DNA (cytosine-5-)-methyltransferase [Vagococcus coleopterorum]|uniref:Cytosine-specific methyltransferase n=1 Tax=Vagococcus coleopterorum TaxID=2714946 RepID=A0A6G8AKY6_9ENTE|nr:DNA (cytosine-5-)-methyltransferase [Vagococcus coleopterorum]QIL45666.1 DNA (cytosine-5-)-methyltransferase [Vagococcus coleopterorum]